MARKKVTHLERDGMSPVVKIMFTLIFFSMGFAIVGAGLRGQPATATIVMTIGAMMVLIGLAPYYVPLLYKRFVPSEVLTS